VFADPGNANQTHIDLSDAKIESGRMGTDEVAVAFAEWIAAHQAYVAAEKRLAASLTISRKMGMLPPQRLVDEVAALNETQRQLLEAANAALSRARRT
jgi:hypothetical protein